MNAMRVFVDRFVNSTRLRRQTLSFGEGVGVDYAGMLQDLLQETDPAAGFRLVPPGFAVSCIIASVPLGAGLREVVRHLGINREIGRAHV